MKFLSPLGDERSHGAGCLRLLNQISDWFERTELCVNTNKLFPLLLCMKALEGDWDNLSRAQITADYKSRLPRPDLQY
jgi:hypothetical protein